MSAYTDADQRADKAFLVGADFGRGQVRARVEALADGWEQRAKKCREAASRPTVTLGQQHAYLQDAGVYSDAARGLRAALAEPTEGT